jgi:hypothetical protein
MFTIIALPRSDVQQEITENLIIVREVPMGLYFSTNFLTVDVSKMAAELHPRCL